YLTVRTVGWLDDHGNVMPSVRKRVTWRPPWGTATAHRRPKSLVAGHAERDRPPADAEPGLLECLGDERLLLHLVHLAGPGGRRRHRTPGHQVERPGEHVRQPPRQVESEERPGAL